MGKKESSGKPISLAHTPVIDAHCHFGAWGTYEIEARLISPFIGRELCSYDDVRQYCQAKYLEMVVLVPMYGRDARRTYDYNGHILNCANVLKDYVVPCFWVDPSPATREMLQSALSLAGANHIRVLKMSPSIWTDAYEADPDSWDKEFAEGVNLIAEYGRRESCVLQIHTGGSKSDIRGVEKLMRHLAGGLTFHLVHMGGRINSHFYFVPRLPEWLNEGIDVYFDMSLAAGFAVRWLVKEGMHNETILSRVMFASDEPWGVYESELAKIRDAVGQDDELLNRVLRENAFGLYANKRLVR